jgi:hypothetical protein
MVIGGFLVTPVLLSIFLAAIMLGRDLPRVKLDVEGVEISHALWRVYRMRWSEVARFRSYLFLAFHVDTKPPDGRWDRFQRAWLRGDYRFWTDTFGLGAKDFACLMNAWRERALAQQR